MLLYTRKSIERERRNKNNEQKGGFRKRENPLFLMRDFWVWFVILHSLFSTICN